MEITIYWKCISYIHVRSKDKFDFYKNGVLQMTSHIIYRNVDVDIHSIDYDW